MVKGDNPVVRAGYIGNFFITQAVIGHIIIILLVIPNKLIVYENITNATIAGVSINRALTKRVARGGGV